MLFRFGVLVIAYNVATSALAWWQGWPPQVGGSQDPDQSYASFLVNGSAISAPAPMLAVLLAGLLLAHRLPRVGAVVVVLVAAVFVFVGVIGEFLAEHPHVPIAAVHGFGYALTALSVVLSVLAVRSWRAAGEKKGAPAHAAGQA